MFDWDEAKRISAFAREKGIGMHLDGARLFIASAYTGISPAEYAAHFDTVYVSLWKYFNCGIGAILAGPKRVLDGMFHVRRMFGGNLAVGLERGARRAAFHGRLRRAAEERGADLRDVLRRDGETSASWRIERIPNGTNLTRVTFKGVSVADVAKRLGERGIAMSAPPGPATITFGVNETWNRMSAADLIRAFEQSPARPEARLYSPHPQCKSFALVRASARTKSSIRSASVAWARCIAPPIHA